MISVGIDLGTTNTLAAAYLDDGRIEFVKDNAGKVLMPSAVAMDAQKEVVIGAAAKHRLTRDPANTFTRFKRAMGTQEKFKLGRQKLTATDLSALLLRRVYENIQAQFSEDIGEVVISVPAYFNSVQRQETLMAAELAGFTVARLVNEPTAAALAYGLQDKEDESLFIVLDLGGGTFDVSILEMFEGVMEVRASAGDAFLGGEDFTKAVADHFAQEAGLEWAKLDAESKEALYAAAEQLKCSVGPEETVRAQVPLKGKELGLSLSLDEFETITASLAMRIRKPIERCLYDAKLSVADIERIILVGGATRMPMMRSLVARMFQKLPERTLDPDMVVAQGAAIQAALSAKNEMLNDVVMTDVSPFSLGIAARQYTQSGFMDDGFSPLIERNTTLPASRMHNFATLGNNQTNINIHVYQGESPVASENIKLGEMQVKVPARPAGQESVNVRFSYDVSGLLQVEVTVVSTGKTSEMVIEGSAAKLSPAERAKRMKVLESYKVNPRDMQENVEVLENLKHLFAMHLGQDREHIRDLITQFETVLAAQDPREIERVREAVQARIASIESGYVT